MPPFRTGAFGSLLCLARAAPRFDRPASPSVAGRSRSPDILAWAGSAVKTGAVLSEGIAITGLRTPLGLRLAQRLAGPAGRRVIGLGHTRPGGLPAQVVFHRVDATGPGAEERIAALLQREGVDALAHLASWRRSGEAGDRLLPAAAAAAGVRRLVLASSTQCYGASAAGPQYFQESAPLRAHPDAPRVQRRVELERAFTGFAAERPQLTLTVLRCCWTLGAHSRGPEARYFAPAVVPTLLGYDPLLQLLHEDDQLAVFEQATLAPHPGVFNIVAPGVVPLSVLLRSAGKRNLPLPAAWLRRAGYLRRLLPLADAPSDAYDYLRYAWLADGAKGFAEFGRPLYSTRETWAAFVAAGRSGKRR